MRHGALEKSQMPQPLPGKFWASAHSAFLGRPISPSTCQLSVFVRVHSRVYRAAGSLAALVSLLGRRCTRSLWGEGVLQPTRRCLSRASPLRRAAASGPLRPRAFTTNHELLLLFHAPPTGPPRWSILPLPYRSDSATTDIKRIARTADASPPACNERGQQEALGRGPPPNTTREN